MESPPASDNVAGSFDPSRPFHGLVLCCTSIEADQRTEIAQRTADMGGVHKYDLTLDVTHLIVGDYNTPKYRHVAKERPDIKPMAVGWIEAVRKLWVEDKDIDFAALEEEWKLRTFESAGHDPRSPNPAESERQRLVCCLTGFEDNNVRAMIEQKVNANGGVYVGDLSRRVTHLITAKPEGKKYSAALKWSIRCVAIEWLHDSIERGMILNEDCYDPTLPLEEIGKGAWSRRDTKQTVLGKRAREESTAPAQVGRRKLRKSASSRMNSQNNDLWGDILNQSGGDHSRPTTAKTDGFSEPDAPVRADSVSGKDEATQPVVPPVLQPAMQPQSNSSWPGVEKGVFSSCRFHVHGFPEARKQILFGFLTSHGGQLSPSLEDTASLSHGEPLNQRFLLVPQISSPDSYPKPPAGVHTITEFFIERCIHNKKLFSPSDHVLGRPFPQFPIGAFQSLTICTAGFINEQLNQIEKTVTQLGATYSEKLNKQAAVLVCPDLRSLRQQKRDLAIFHGIPVIKVEWLWQCITEGCLVPWESFQFEELARHADSLRASMRRREENKRQGRDMLYRARSDPTLTKPLVERPNCRSTAPSARAGFDMTAFDGDYSGESSYHRKSSKSKSVEAAAARIPKFDDAFASEPLPETTTSDTKQATLSPKRMPSPTTFPQEPPEREVADSEAGDESDTTTRASKEPQSHDAETAHKREAQQAKENERRELSKRLNSLVSNEDESQEDNSSNKAQPTRRKREVLGRAISNVSAASSLGGDTAPAWDSMTRSKQTASKPDGSELEKFLDSPRGDSVADPDTLPPSTQLEYDNPEARKQRQVVLDRIMGHKQTTATTTGESEDPKSIRLADLDPTSPKRAMRRRVV